MKSSACYCDKNTEMLLVSITIGKRCVHEPAGHDVKVKRQTAGTQHQSNKHTEQKKKKVSFLYLFCFYPDCSCFHLPPFLQKETFITTLLKFLLVRVKRVSCGVVLSRRAAPPQPPCAPRRFSVTTLRSSQLPLIYSPPPCVYM